MLDVFVANVKMGFMSYICVVILLIFNLGHAKDCEISALPPDRDSGCCGRAVGVTKAIPGPYAQLSQYPWMGIIEYDRNNIKTLTCGAILISGRYMLTAAQCFRRQMQQFGKPSHVYLGEYNTTNEGPDCVDVGGSQECNDGALKIPIEKVISHPDFQRHHKFNNDIALIRLAQMAPINDFIKPICLPSSDITIEAPKEYMWAAGWGAINDPFSTNDRLHHVDLPYVDFDTCQTVINNRRLKLGQGQLCAGGEKGKDTCIGDSGGPLMFVRDKTTEVVGITSFGKSCGRAGIPGVYTNVFAYNSWIRANIED